MYIGVSERLNCFRVLPGLYEKRRQRVTEIVETKPDGIPLFQHSSRNRRWPQMILNQHVGDTWLFPF